MDELTGTPEHFRSKLAFFYAKHEWNNLQEVDEMAELSSKSAQQQFWQTKFAKWGLSPDMQPIDTEKDKERVKRRAKAFFETHDKSRIAEADTIDVANEDKFFQEQYAKYKVDVPWEAKGDGIATDSTIPAARKRTESVATSASEHNGTLREDTKFRLRWITSFFEQFSPKNTYRTKSCVSAPKPLADTLKDLYREYNVPAEDVWLFELRLKHTEKQILDDYRARVRRFFSANVAKAPSDADIESHAQLAAQGDMPDEAFWTRLYEKYRVPLSTKWPKSRLPDAPAARAPRAPEKVRRQDSAPSKREESITGESSNSSQGSSLTETTKQELLAQPSSQKNVPTPVHRNGSTTNAAKMTTGNGKHDAHSAISADLRSPHVSKAREHISKATTAKSNAQVDQATDKQYSHNDDAPFHIDSCTHSMKSDPSVPPKSLNSNTKAQLLRGRLYAFFVAHEPSDKVPEKVQEAILTKHCSNITEEELFKRLEEGYKNQEAHLRKRLTEFYTEHNPKELYKVELAMQAGLPEDVLFAKLHERHSLPAPVSTTEPGRHSVVSERPALEAAGYPEESPPAGPHDLSTRVRLLEAELDTLRVRVGTQSPGTVVVEAGPTIYCSPPRVQFIPGGNGQPNIELREGPPRVIYENNGMNWGPHNGVPQFDGQPPYQGEPYYNGLEGMPTMPEGYPYPEGYPEGYFPEGYEGYGLVDPGLPVRSKEDLLRDWELELIRREDKVTVREKALDAREAVVGRREENRGVTGTAHEQTLRVLHDKLQVQVSKLSELEEYLLLRENRILKKEEILHRSAQLSVLGVPRIEDRPSTQSNGIKPQESKPKESKTQERSKPRDSKPKESRLVSPDIGAGERPTINFLCNDVRMPPDQSPQALPSTKRACTERDTASPPPFQPTSIDFMKAHDSHPAPEPLDYESDRIDHSSYASSTAKPSGSKKPTTPVMAAAQRRLSPPRSVPASHKSGENKVIKSELERMRAKAMEENAGLKVQARALRDKLSVGREDKKPSVVASPASAGVWSNNK
ncbi:hypothetical protein DIPPA_35038 [Diplonema papillatum]|nr:hypothetical protein DIPPA_35038 [Diplonema papillatum]